MTQRSVVYQEIVQRLNGGLRDLDRIPNRVRLTWSRARLSDPDQDFLIDSVALNLHGFYSGLERIFELIARQIDQTMPVGDMWHRDLLKQMAEPVPELRPAVIGESSFRFLDEMRRFRHLVRNVYTFNLDPNKIDPLANALAETWPRLRLELLAFGEFLTELADASKTQDS